jgi:hypothetical protein
MCTSKRKGDDILHGVGLFLALKGAGGERFMATPEQKKPSDLGQQAIALAEQLGRIAGTIEGTAEAWLNRQSLADQLTRVRDGATEMLESLADGADKGRKAAADNLRTLTDDVRKRALKVVPAKRKAKKAAAPAAASTRRADPAHAPGKRRRKPAPTMRGVKTDESISKLRTAEANRQRRKSHA